MTTTTFFQPSISEPAGQPLATSFRTGSIVGLVDRPEQLAVLMTALSGFGIERGEIETMRSLGTQTDQQGIIERLTGFINSIGPERALARRYRDDMAAGAIMVTVRNVPESAREAVSTTLKSTGARFIHSFGRFTIQSLAA